MAGITGHGRAWEGRGGQGRGGQGRGGGNARFDIYKLVIMTD